MNIEEILEKEIITIDEKFAAEQILNSQLLELQVKKVKTPCQSCFHFVNGKCALANIAPPLTVQPVGCEKFQSSYDIPW